MAFLCFFCKETDVIEWHDVEDGFQPYQPPRRSCGTSGSGLQINSGQSSSPSSCRIITNTLEPSRLSHRSPPRPVNKRSRSGSNKGVRYLKVDIRLPRQEGAPLGTRKVIRLVKIDIRPRQNESLPDELNIGFVSSPNAAEWPFKQRPNPLGREIHEGSESPDIGYFNRSSRDWAKILRVNRSEQEIQEGLDVGFFASPSAGGWAFPTRARQEMYEGPKAAFSGSPSAVWGGESGSKQRRNRPRKEIYERPGSSSGVRSSLPSPSRPRGEVEEGFESPDAGFLTSPSGGWGPRQRPNLYRRRHGGGGSGEIKSAV